MNVFSASPSAATLVAAALALPAQSPIRDYDAPPVPAAGYASYDFALVSDLDHDGLRDVAVRHGSFLEVRSSDTGLPLLYIDRGTGLAGDTRIKSCDDMDGDGYRDLIAGYASEAQGDGAVEVYSGRTGEVLHRKVGGTGWRLGTSICAAGDVDLDGVPDFGAGARGASATGPGGGPDAGRFVIWSGATGAQLFAWAGTGGAKLGSDSVGLGDLDGDGRPSVAVSSHVIDRVLLFEPLGDDPVVAFNGQAGSSFGWTLGSISDLDGDGGRELIIGAVRHGPQDAGRVTVMGSSSLAPLLQVDGLPNQGFGRHFAAAGDFDLDGVEDIVASGLGVSSISGAPGILGWISGATGAVTFDNSVSSSFRGFVAAEDADGDGRADLWHGSSAEFVLERYGDPRVFQNPLRTIRAGDGSGYGEVVATLDDLDGDGWPEVAVAAPFGVAAGRERPGQVRVYSRSNLIYTFDGAPGDHLGTAVCSIDDFNGDGVDEIAIGRPFARQLGVRCGVVTIYSGATGGVLRAHAGVSWGDRFGASIARVPDTNGDGVGDYAIGAPGTTSPVGISEAGRVLLFSGIDGTVRFGLSGAAFRAQFGAALAGIEDLNGDGHGDLLVGAPGDWTSIFNLGAGRVYRRSGSSGQSLGTVTGSQAGMRFGSSLAAVDDLTGDGVPDYVVGAPRFGATEVGDGRIELCDGATGAAFWSDVGTNAGRLGASVCAAGDLDNDGVADFAVGEPQALVAAAGVRAGGVRLYSGRTRVHYLSLAGAAERDRFGASIAAVGDENGDNAPDLVIGAPGRVVDLPDFGLVRHGSAMAWAARSAGSLRFGGGAAGCDGDHNLTLFQPVRPGQTMELRCSGLSPSTFPVLGFGVPLPVGVPALGFLAHVQSSFTLGLPLPTGAFTSHLEPIPNNPALVGAQLHAQLYALWLGGCAQLPFDLSSSNGLTVEVL